MTAWCAASSISTVSTTQSTETRRGRPACGKAYFRPVFRDREGVSCVSAHRPRLFRQVLGRLSPTTKIPFPAAAWEVRSGLHFTCLAEEVLADSSRDTGIAQERRFFAGFEGAT